MIEVKVRCKTCGGLIGLAIDDDFHPKGWHVLRDAAAIAVPLSMLSEQPHDQMQMPCAGREHHWIDAREIADEVASARLRRQFDVAVTPTRNPWLHRPSRGEPLVPQSPWVPPPGARERFIRESMHEIEGPST